MGNKIDWKKWGHSIGQKARIYAVMLLVVALGIGLYGAHLVKSLPAAIQVAAPVVKEPAGDKPVLLPETVEEPTSSASTPQPPLTAVDITPVRVDLPSLAEEEPPTASDDAEALPAAQTAEWSEAAAEPPEPQPAETAAPEPIWRYVDPTQFVAGMPPCKGTISRGYGFTLDKQYADYRYHNGLDYTISDSRSINTVMAGRVVAIDDDAQAITIEQGDLRTIYYPVGDITVSLDQEVSSGRSIGNVPSNQDTLHFALQKQSQ